MRFGFTLSLGALALAGCASTVRFTAAGSNLELAAKPASCKIEFFRSKQPERPYDEIGALHAEGAVGMSGPARPAELQELMRQKACAVGADAVIITRDYLPSRSGSAMTGTAVKYRPAGQAAPEPREPAAGEEPKVTPPQPGEQETPDQPEPEGPPAVQTL